MPWTKKQRGLFGSDLARIRAGKRPVTGMSERQLTKAMGEGTKPASGHKKMVGEALERKMRRMKR